MATLCILCPMLIDFHTFDEVSSADCNIIKDTEPIDRVSTPRVMARRPDRGEPIFPLISHYAVNALQDPSHCNFGACFRVLIEVSVEDCDVAAVGSLGPKVLDMLDILLFMCEGQVCFINFSVDDIDVVYLRVLQDAYFGQPAYESFCSLGSLWMFSLALMVEHSWVVDDSSFPTLHYFSIIILNLPIIINYYQLFGYSDKVRGIKIINKISRGC